jgi:hypothetical protein
VFARARLFGSSQSHRVHGFCGNWRLSLTIVPNSLFLRGFPFFAGPATKRQKRVECRLIQHRRRPSNPAILLFSRPVITGIRIYLIYLPVSEVFNRFNGLSEPISTSYAQKKGKLRRNSEFGTIVNKTTKTKTTRQYHEEETARLTLD